MRMIIIFLNIFENKYLLQTWVTDLSFSMVTVTPFISGGDLHKLWKITGCFDIELIKIYVGELALAIGKEKKTIFNTVSTNGD